MYVKELISILSEMQPDDEIFALIWNKDDIEQATDLWETQDQISKEQAHEIILRLDKQEWDSEIASAIWELYRELNPQPRSCNTCRTEGGCRCDAIHDQRAGK
jgi:hypothetical protein